MGRLTQLALAAIATLAISSCASMEDVLREKEEGGGTTVAYNVSFEEAWEISRVVFRWEGCDQIEEHKLQRYMLTTSGGNAVSSGAVMGAWIEPIDDENQSVTVITKRKVATNLATTLTEGTFHETCQQAVDIVNSGETLPLTKPRADG